MDRAQRIGEASIFAHAFLWGFFPVVTVSAAKTLPAVYVAACSTIFSALFFFLFACRKPRRYFVIPREAWRDILYASLIIGVCFYGVMFYGVSQTSSGNAGIMLLMEVFFTMVILPLVGSEKITRTILLGGSFMVVGAALVLFQGSLAVEKGDVIVLASTAIPPLGNYYLQRARRNCLAVSILLVRNAIAGVALFLFALLLAPLPERSAFFDSLFLLVMNGVLLLGLAKILWIEAIHRLPVSKTISLNSLAPAFTLLFAYLFLQEIPTWWQIAGLLPVALGIWVLTRGEGKKRSRKPA